MIIHTLKKYMNYSRQGLVDKIVCGLDESHDQLSCGMTLDDRVYLFCIHCEYKIFPGFNSLKKISLDVYRIDVEKKIVRQITK